MSVISLLVLGVLAASPTAEATETKAKKPSLKEVVKKVQENERLYSTFEMRVLEETTLVNRGNPIPSTVSCYLIQDGEQFLRKLEYSSVPEAPNQPRSYSYTVAYDGQKTRSIAKTNASIKKGRHFPEPICHPYTWLYFRWYDRGLNPPFPFSKFLTMPDTKSHEMRWTVLGEEKFNDLRCVKLKFEMVAKTDSKCVMEANLWLAVDRNYLPVSSVRVTPAIHPKLDDSYGQVKSLKEVQPGVWVPQDIEYFTNDGAELEKGITVLNRHNDIKVRDVIIGKEYNVEVFRPKIPPGVKIQKSD